MAYTRTDAFEHFTRVAERYWKGCLKGEASGPLDPHDQGPSSLTLLNIYSTGLC